jgi:hypothetical protein
MKFTLHKNGKERYKYIDLRNQLTYFLELDRTGKICYTEETVALSMPIVSFIPMTQSLCKTYQREKNNRR